MTLQRHIPALSYLPDTLNQIDMFGSAGSSCDMELPEVTPNTSGVLVDGIEARYFRAGRDYVEICIARHQNRYYTSVSIHLGTEYSGHLPSITQDSSETIGRAWSLALEVASRRVRGMVGVVRSNNEGDRGRRAGALLALLNAGVYSIEDCGLRSGAPLRQPKEAITHD